MGMGRREGKERDLGFLIDDIDGLKRKTRLRF